MNVPSFKTAVGGLLLTGGLALSTTASAGIALNTTALKADAVVQFSLTSNDALSAAQIVVSSLGNATKLSDATEVDPTDGQGYPVPRFNMPVTKADISIGWDLKITANSGESVRSVLKLQRNSNAVGLANFSIDFNKKIVYADGITGTVLTPKIAVYTFDVVEPQKISFPNLVLNQSVKIGNLKVTEQSKAYLGTGLNLAAPLQASLATIDFGTISVLVTSFKRTKVSDTRYTAADFAASK